MNEFSRKIFVTETVDYIYLRRSGLGDRLAILPCATCSRFESRFQDNYMCGPQIILLRLSVSQSFVKWGTLQHSAC